MLPMFLAFALQAAAVAPANTWPTHEQDIVLKDFHFHDGEALPHVRMHITT